MAERLGVLSTTCKELALAEVVDHTLDSSCLKFPPFHFVNTLGRLDFPSGPRSFRAEKNNFMVNYNPPYPPTDLQQQLSKLRYCIETIKITIFIISCLRTSKRQDFHLPTFHCYISVTRQAFPNQSTSFSATPPPPPRSWGFRDRSACLPRSSTHGEMPASLGFSDHTFSSFTDNKGTD